MDEVPVCVVFVFHTNTDTLFYLCFLLCEKQPKPKKKRKQNFKVRNTESIHVTHCVFKIQQTKIIVTDSDTTHYHICHVFCFYFVLHFCEFEKSKIKNQKSKINKTNCHILWFNLFYFTICKQ